MSIWYICSSSLTLSLFSWMQFNVQKRMKCFNVITLMFSVSASININEMKLEMTSAVWKVKILWNWMIFLQFQNHIAPFQELCFLNNFGIIFLQFQIIFLQFQNYISPIPELYFSNSGIIFPQFQIIFSNSRIIFLHFQGQKFPTENRPCSNRAKFLSQLWTFQWNSNVLVEKLMPR